MKNWPPLTDQGTIPGGIWSETEFLVDLAASLWDEACKDPSMAQALAKRILGGYDPADPLLNTQLAREFKARQDKPESFRDCSGFDSIEESKRARMVEMVMRTEEASPE
jgi:hypothetical protein